MLDASFSRGEARVAKVSCTFCGWFGDILEQSGRSTEAWLRDLGVDPATLRDPQQQIDWDLFAELCERLEAEFASREELLAATRRCASARFSHEAAHLPGSFTDQRQLYWMTHRWMRPAVLPAFSSTYDELSDGRLRIALEAPADAPGCSLLFEMIQGTLMNAPLLVGQPATRVDAEITEGRAVYTIVPSSRADEDLREREERYRRLTEHASDIIAELTDDGVILYASPNCLEILGTPSSDLLDQCIFDFVHPDDRAPDRKLVSEYLGDRESGEKHFRMRHRDGSWLWFHVATKRAKGPDSAERFIIVGRDVTEQKRAEIASEDWRDRYEAIIRASGRLVYDCDMKTGSIEFRGEGEQLGFRFDRSGSNLSEYLVDLSPEDRDRFVEELERAMRAKDHFHIEYSLQRPGREEITVENDGYFILDDEGEIRRMVGFAHDITERKKGEKALRDSQDLLDRIASASPEILYVFDAEAWRMVYVNDAIEPALGVTSQEVLRVGAEFLVQRLHPDDRETVAGYRTHIRELSDGGIVQVTCRVRHADGEWCWLRLRNRVLSRNADGGIREILGTASDVTEHIRAQQALRISEERYRIVSDLTSDYSFSVRIDADRSMVREWITEAFARITGYEPEEMGESQWERLVHPDDRERGRDQFKRAFLSGRAIHVYRIIRKTGEVRWIREHASVIHNDDGSLHWYGACRDITEQKTAESDRALTEERFNAITQSSHDIIVEFDETGKNLYVSPNVLELVGHPPEAFESQRRVDLVHPDDAQMVKERLAKMMHGGESEDLIFRFLNGEGEWRWLDTTATAFHTASGDVRGVMIIRDITERLEMEEERQRLASIVENSSEFIAMIAADGRILFLNDAGKKMVGISSDAEARSRTIFECLVPEDAQDMRFQVVPSIERSGHWEGDFRLRHVATSERIATLAHVFLVSHRRWQQEQVLAIVARDISERITAERLLRESEARHRMLVESAYDLIAEIDLHGHYVYANPNFDRQLGYTPEQLLGASWFDQVHPEDRGSARKAIGDLFEHETRECPPLRLRHVDGSWLWVETNLKKYENITGEPLVLAFFRDISRRKAAEEALRQSQEELLHSQKMEAIGRLAGGVAHDFNNLLTAITGYCDLLLEEIGDASELRADAEEIIRAAERAGGLTRQLLAFSRRQVLLPKVLDLNTLVADVDRLLRRLIGEDIELVTVLEGELPHVKLDPGQLEQLVLNLAVNARDAMPRGGRLTISTNDLEIGPGGDPAHPGIEPARYVTLSVRDTGVGMTPQTQSKIFEPFFTTKEAGKGTGLGLATVYGIIQQSGGEIRVESEVGRGSTFTVYLPQVDEAVDPPEPVVVHEDLRGGETILLVEDSETVRKLVKRYLEKHGYTVIDAPSGIDALRCAKRHDGDIDLLVTDVVLPKMDGHALAQRLNRIRPGMKVVYMSGFSDDALSRHGVVASDIVLVQKPFAQPVLLREVRRILGDPKTRAPARAAPAPANPAGNESG
jgi:PAS domain S-box-containing protein